MNLIRDRRGRGEFIQSMLSEDHAQLEQVFRSLVSEAHRTDPWTLRALWQRFERQLFTHMDLEEQEIIPAFAERYPEEARLILDDHARIRAAVGEMGLDLERRSAELDRVEEIVELLRLHVRREEGLFYRWAGGGDQPRV